MLRFLTMLAGLILFVLISAGLAYTYAMRLYEGEGPLAEQRLILIPQGFGLNTIGQKLENEGLVHSKWLIILGARINGVQGELKAGEYLVPPRISAKDLLDMIVQGRIYLRQFTIPEGMSSRAVFDLLNGLDDMSGTLPSPTEGSIMPETYRYQFNDSRITQIGLMQQAMRNTLDVLWDSRDVDLPLNSKEEALILASIVEKETGVPEERKRVAGVFLNRMRIGMPLQSDPTIVYALTEGREALGRPLTRADLSIDSRYNTYRYGGLPPTPICNPGRASLEAVLNPEHHRFLYFVADGTGGHVFATSLEEHNRNVANWRIIRDRAREEQKRRDMGMAARPAPGYSLRGDDTEEDSPPRVDKNTPDPMRSLIPRDTAPAP